MDQTTIKWEVVNLVEHCRPKQWKTLSIEELTDEGFSVYGANGKIGFYHTYTHEFPTLMISCRGANCGNVHISEAKSYINGNAMALDNLSSAFNTKFLYYYFLKRGFNDVISGSAQPQITGQGLSKVRIPLPPLSNQKLIAEILDKADALRKKDQQLLQYYDELAQSLFIDMFGDPVKNEKGWPVFKIGEVSTSKLGKMLDGGKTSSGQSYKYLGNSNVLWHRFQFEDLKEMNFTDEEKIKYKLEYGDILMCEGGEAGRCAIWKKDESEIFFQKAIHRIKVDESIISPEYFVWNMFMLLERKALKNYITSATISHLTGEKLKIIPIQIPPVALQNQFAAQIQNIEQQKEKLKEQMQDSENLFQALLQKAFNGGLN